MHTLDVRNVNSALGYGIQYLLNAGVEEESRNGKVLVAPGPVCTTYTKPEERVLFSGLRNANPFFHLMEALWMLAGRDDLEWVSAFNKRFGEYSDNGATIHGAYGFRWRRFFMFDQLEEIVSHLSTNPTSRRAVLTMWSPEGDLIPHQLRAGAFGYAGEGGKNSKDVPCNTHAYFDLRNNRLNMTVCNRSNDIIWGAYGANAVHFSIMQEWMAARLGVDVGVYRQISNNYHAYLDVYSEKDLMNMAAQAHMTNYYSSNPHMKRVTLMSTSFCDWNDDLMKFMERVDVVEYNDPFFNTVAEPMFMAWLSYKFDTLETAKSIIQNNMPDNCDWKIASLQWLERVEVKRNERAA